MDVLELLRGQIPRKIFSTNSFEKKGLYKKLKEKAIEEKYIQIQLKDRLIHSLTFDLDYEGAVFAYESTGLPLPSLICINPQNGHAHVTYILTSPVPTTEKARSQPIYYLNAIKAAYASKLKADLGYAWLITKNPFYSGWRVIKNNKTYDLNELAEYVNLSLPCEKLLIKSGNVYGRNCTIFDATRKIAYKLVKKYINGDGEAFSFEIQTICNQHNFSFSEKLGQKEVDGIAKSISEWVWANRRTIGKDALSKILIEKIETALFVIKLTRPLLANLEDKLILKHYQIELANTAKVSLSSIKRFAKKGGIREC